MLSFELAGTMLWIFPNIVKVFQELSLLSRILENKFYSLLLLWFTIAAMLIYAYAGSHAVNPQLVLPPSIHALHGVQGRKAIQFDDVLRINGLLTLQSLKAVRNFDSSIRLVGGLKSPVEFIINFDDRNRYNVTESRIELGARWLEQSGQIEKALTKAWIFQLSRSDITASLLRTEVASDLLWAMLNGEFSVGQMSFPKTQHWMLFASSFSAQCSSHWLSPELNVLCSSRDTSAADSIQAIGFRPLLDAMVWQVYKELPLVERIEFIRAWTSWIVEPPPQPELEHPGSTLEWRNWLKAEFASVMPKTMKQRDFSDKINLIYKEAGLTGDKTLEIKYLFRNDAAGFKDSQLLGDIFSIGNEKFWRNPVLAMAKTKDGYVTLPGRARMPEGVEKDVHFKEMVFEACVEPSIDNLLTDTVDTERILYVRDCDKPFSPQYIPLVTLGVKGFAAANPRVPFVLIQKPFMQIAARRGWTGRAELLKDLMDKSAELNSVSPNMGLRQAHWFPEVRAYKVVGAVEAVEWYRSSKD